MCQGVADNTLIIMCLAYHLGRRSTKDDELVEAGLFATYRHGRMPVGGLRGRFVCLTLFPNNGVSHNDLPQTAVRSTSLCPWFEKHRIGCLRFNAKLYFALFWPGGIFCINELCWRCHVEQGSQ